MKTIVQIWAKGYSLRGSSKEFNLVVPASKDDLVGIETALGTFDGWGELVESLYKVGPSTLERQFASLFSGDEFLCACAAPSTDHLNRVSVVLVAVSGKGLSWGDSETYQHVSKAHRLSLRLAKSYGSTLAGGLPKNLTQLQAGTFLRVREFDLSHEQDVDRMDWKNILDEVGKWQGITGIATPLFANLGANVMYGTRDELNTIAHQDCAKGIFDIAEGEIVPIGNELRPWKSPRPKSEEQSHQDGNVENVPTSRVEGESLELILNAILEMRDALLDFLDFQKSNKKRKK